MKRFGGPSGSRAVAHPTHTNPADRHGGTRAVATRAYQSAPVPSAEQDLTGGVMCAVGLSPADPPE
jgi:hypothetical protein